MRAVPRCRPRNEAEHRLELLFYCSGDVEAVDSHQQRAVPVFVSELKDHRLVPGETALLECVVAGDPPPEIVWTRRGHPLLDKTRYRPTRPPILSGAGFTTPTRPPTLSRPGFTRPTRPPALSGAEFTRPTRPPTLSRPGFTRPTRPPTLSWAGLVGPLGLLPSVGRGLLGPLGLLPSVGRVW